MINKLVIVIAVFVIAVSLAVGGCGKNENLKVENPSSAEEAKASHQEKEEDGVIAFSSEKLKEAGIETQKVTLEQLSPPISATAAIELNADRAAKVGPRLQGKIVSISASQGDRVKAGRVLASMDSAELDQTWADYLKATGKVELAEKDLRREETLFEKKVSPEKDVLKARQELGEAEAELNLAKEKFRLVGINPSQADPKKNGHHPLVPITTPISGVIIEKTVTQGEIVSPDKTLFTIADLSSLWVVIDIYEKDIARLRPGTSVAVSVTAFPDRVFRGRLSYIGDIVDEKTRTEKARVTIDNSSGLLKPGMFATVTIDTKSAEIERIIVVPEDAVQMEGNIRYVFVQTGSGKFKRREVTVGRSLDRKTEITGGLKEGETIAVKGSFIIKSELKKGELEGE